MMATAPIQGSLRTTSQTAWFTIPDGSLESDHFSAAIGKELAAAKSEHLHKAGTNFDLAIAATPVSRQEIVFVASAAGTINKFAALLNVDGSSTLCEFDLLKNGSSVLSGVVAITHSTGNRVVVEATVAATTFVAGDVFSIDMTVTSATGAQGPFAWAEFVETLG